MSVENVDGASTDDGFPERRDNMCEEGVKEGKEESSPTPVASNSTDSATPAEGAEFLPDTGETNCNKKEMMTWMTGLDEIELFAASTMEDVPYLASFLAVLSWSSAVRGQTDRPSGASLDTSFFWRHLVSPSEIRAVHNRICDDFKTGEGVLITSRWISSIQASIGESRSMSSDVAGKTIVLEDDIRIRNESDTASEMSDIQVFWSLLEHVRVVFPSAVSHVTGQPKSNSTYLTFSPPILRKYGARKIYNALNAGLKLFAPDKEFLLSSSDDESWVDALLSAAESDQQDGSQIPVFVVLLFRLEQAFREAYKASASVSFRSDVDDEQPPVGERPTHAKSLDYHAFADSLTQHLCKLEQAQVDDDEKRSVTSDLAKACGGADVRSIQLSDLLVTPLGLVSRSMDSDGIGSLVAVDDIIRVALDRFHSITSLKKANPGPVEPVSRPASAVAHQSQSTHGSPENGTQRVNAKKKKKRKPKKKQGKGRGSESQKADASTTETAKSDSTGGNGKKGSKGEGESVMTAESNGAQGKSEERDDESHSPGETESVTVESPGETKAGGAGTAEAEHVTRPTGELTTVVPTSGYGDSSSKLPEESHDDGDTWETVEVKPRNQRKKGQNNSSSRKSAGSGLGQNDNGSKKPKEKRTSQSRKKNATRKMVREILSNVVDSVEEESMRRQKLAATASSENRWKKGPPLSGAGRQASSASTDTVPTRPKTLRDIVMGSSSGNSVRSMGGGVTASTASGAGKAQSTTDHTKKRHNHVDSPKRGAVSNASDGPKKGNQHQRSAAKKTDAAPESPKRTHAEKTFPKANTNDSPAKSKTGKWAKGKSVVAADQNTAPTYQETVSAMSGTSNRVSDRPAAKTSHVEPSKSDSSSGDTDEAPQNRDRAVSPIEKEASSSAPPLLTLVSPENANSATSSVASSLEVPHASRRHHHSACTPDITDVGYHLLDVCDRLSRDMNLFMEKRQQAISIRRRERGAVLAALQDSLSNIWPRMCTVQMYGSCATLLDLPSADLDVVVVGLDHSEMLANQIAASQQQQQKKRSNSSGSKHRRSASKDGQAVPDTGRGAPTPHASPPPVPPAHSPHLHPGAYVPLPIYRNSERVKQLAIQLEGQPWAVQIKSLPNATVPVIKILADPSKLLGMDTGADWPTPLPDGTDVPDETPKSATGTTSVQAEALETSGRPAPTQNLYEPWRGSDVMNGLISLDITFEGPEHGGLGSTDFSVHVVNEACQEAGTLPEATPFVQCLMVLKELLVQRKLNEPYSGGLSSYALLLLLLALVRERALIRQEIERAECQRQAMAEGGVATYAGALNGTSVNEGAFASEVRAEEVAEASNMKHVRSWANIAKKPNTTTSALSVSSEKLEKKVSQEAGKPKLDRPASFADAVARPKGKSLLQEKEEQPVDGSSFSDDRAKATNTDVSSTATPTQRSPDDPNALGMPSFYPQGFDDVIEVLCTGETTAGKLLMHFLLYYGQYFDAQATAIDISGKHERVFMGHYSPYSYLSPYIPRRAPETIDPHTGMLVVDHIVVYDPLEGAENNNVARRCFAWQQVKWIFSQSYATLSSAVERSSSPPATPNGRLAAPEGNAGVAQAKQESTGGDLIDPSSSLLRCLLSF